MCGSIPTVNSTLSIDLTQPWTVGTVNALLSLKPSAMTTLRRPYLWYDPVSNFIYERGGWGYSENSYSLWSFQPDGHGGVVWNVAQDNSVAEQYTSTVFSAFTASNTKFYALYHLRVQNSARSALHRRIMAHMRCKSILQPRYRVMQKTNTRI
jgi:hypothetical protein